MAIFDALTFNPQGYGGQGGGLLDLLRSIQMQQQYQPAPQSNDLQGPSGHIKVGDYSMPQFGPRELYQPQQAALPANAQPTQGQMPAQQPQSNNLMTGLQGFIGNLHNGPIGAIAGGLGGAITGQRTDPGGIAQQQANQTAQALQARGLEPALAMTVARNPEMLRAILPQLMGVGGQTQDIKEYERAKRDPEFAKYMESKRAGAGEVSLNPVWGEDGKGNPVLGQLNKRGEFVQTKLPPGVTPSKGVDRIDLGTEWGVVSKVNGQLIGRYSKDIIGKESAEERGKIQGQAQGELPAAQIAADRTIKQIEDFEKSAGFNEVFGLVDQFRPNFTMSDAGRKSLTQFKQLEGRAFLEGRALLKGGGAITDFESNKAEAAIARLGRSQSEADAKEALQEFKEAVREGVAKLRARAGGVAPAAATAAPKRIRLNADGSVSQ